MNFTIPYFHKVRQKHEKFYEYVINIHEIEGVSRIIHRRYNYFFNFQHQLLELFPKEAGSHNPSERQIPSLPGKVIIRTEKERQVAANRRPLLEAYCNSIFKLPPFIWRHRHVVQFFACTDEDVKKTVEQQLLQSAPCEISGPSALQVCRVMQSHSARDSAGREFAAKAGDTAAVMQRTDTGYWLVDVGGRVGWFPAEFLSAPESSASNSATEQRAGNGGHRDGGSGVVDAFVCIRGFAEEGSGVSVLAGEILVAVERRASGWWSVRRGSGRLLNAVPAVNMRPADPRFVDRCLLFGPESATANATLSPPRAPPLPPPPPRPPPPPQPRSAVAPSAKPPGKPPPPKPDRQSPVAPPAPRQQPADARPRQPEVARKGDNANSNSELAPGSEPTVSGARSGMVKSMASRFESG